MYSARAALEREYAAKLQLLAKKAGEKKSKMESLFILGNDPTKSWDAKTLKQRSTCDPFHSTCLALGIID